jgi:hypothetical protein
VRGDSPVDYTQYPGHGFGVASKQKAEREWKAKYPLAHGLMRQNFIYQQGGTIRHSTCTTTGAEAALLAAERDQSFIVAGLAADPEETMFKSATLQVFVKFISDVCW